MKNYKEFNQIALGTSDIASITVRTPMDAFVVHFGKDSDYYAYLIEGEAEIGGHYTLVKECDACWMRVFDDNKLTFESKNYYGTYNTLRIFRAGEHGCIIQFMSI